MAIVYKDINLLTNKASVEGTEKIEISDTQYITPAQIAALAATSGSFSRSFSGAFDGGKRSSGANVLVEGTWADIKALRDGGRLNPGTWYRITDYVATTTDTESRSANHPFDVIVMAGSNSELLEEGFAAIHSGDTYFAGNNLSAWKVWYSIDNDTTRFAWADTTNGKGVVYRLIDEFNNDVPYDFKGIQFKRYAVTAESTYTASIGQLNGLCIGQTGAKGFTLNTSTYEWYYTFTMLGSTLSADKTDGSLANKAHDVVFSRSIQRNTLLNNVFATGPAAQSIHTQLGLTLSAPDYTVVAANLTFADASYKLTVIGDICNSEANETQMRENLFVGSARHNVYKSDFQNNTIVGDYIFNTAQLSDNVIFVKDSMARVAIERLSGNYIYTSSIFYNSRGVSVTNNTFVIQSGSENSVFGVDFGVQFQNNTINGRFIGNSFQYFTSDNTFNADVIVSTFNTTQFRYNTVNTPIACCVFAGPIEYIDIPSVSNKYFAYADVGALRASTSEHIQLGNSEFFVSALTGFQRRVSIESNDDGQIVATWKDTNGVSTGVYASPTESRSNTWHTIPASGGDTSACVHKTGDETVGGDKTFTDNIGVVDADHIVYSGGGGGGGFTKGVETFGTISGQTITFTGLSGEPKAFVLSAITDSIGGGNYTNGVVSVVMDSTGCKAIYNTGTQHNYSSAFSTSYSNGTLVITAPSGVTWPSSVGGVSYGLVYYYGDGTLTFRTSTIQPGSGVTSVTFTGTELTEVPSMYACLLESAVNSESYRRVALYTNSALDEGDTQVPLGITFYSQTMADTTSSFSVSYNNGLYINSGGTNAGGYFHNPGTYKLYYLMASDVAGGGSGGFQSLGDELDDIRDTISGIETLLAAI